MKIVKKYADTKKRDKRNPDDIIYIVVQSFKNNDTSHYHVVDGNVIQVLPDCCISDSVNGGKLNKLGVYHGICTRLNSISIGIKDFPDDDDIKICRDLILTIKQRYKIKDENIIRQLDITGELSPEKWFDRDKWEDDVLQCLKILKDN